MRTLATRARAINQYNGLGNQLWDLAGNRPSLDLRFAETKSLVDATTGTNLADFTRASSGTYVGSDGLIKTATTNLLLRSEEFETAGIWLAGGSSFVTPNAIEAPNETLTADMYTTTGAVESTYQNVAVVPSTEYVFSLYVRLGTMSAANYKIAVYNNTSSSFIALDVAPTQVPTSTGWTRIDYKFTAPSGCTSARVYPFRNSAVILSSTVYFWGAQLEQSSTVGEYIPTTSTINSAPRFDHDPVTGESLGLLVEESRVNNVLQSESVTTSPWGALGSPTFTINNAISPAGSLTADLVVGNNSEAFAGAAQTLSSLVIGNSYSVSLFVKPNTATTTRLGLFNAATTLWNFYVDISWTAGIPSTQSTFGSPTNVEYQSYGNGWYRCSLTGAIDTTTPQFIFQPDRTVASKSAWIWGASVESGSAGASAVFPTSYIPTEGSAVTRAADVASISGSNFSSWYRQDEGTVFAEFDTKTWNSSPYFPKVYTLSDGTDANNIWIGSDNTADDVYRYRIRSGNVNYFGPANTLRLRDSANKVAVRLFSDAGLSADGNTVITGSSVSIPSVNSLALGADYTSNINLHNGTIRRLTYWQTRLPDSTLQGITQQ